MRSLPVRLSVYCPRAAMGAREVDVLVFAHGLLNVCKPAPRNPPEDLIVEDPFRLSRVVDASGRALLLIVPLFDWNGSDLLADPAHLNALVGESRERIAALLGAPPAMSNLILAGHSRAYSFLEGLIKKRAAAAMNQAALARLSEVWMFDTTYWCDIPAWMELLGSKPGLKVSVFYRTGTGTSSYGQALGRKVRESGGRLAVTALDPVRIGHCEVPGSQLPGLLASYSGANPPLAPELDVETHALSLRKSILEAADREWNNWKRGTVEEKAAEAIPLLTGYWAAVGAKVTPEQLQSPVWQAGHPWSAAFVSYVMRQAGAGRAFEYAPYHAGYIVAAKRAAARQYPSKFQAFPIDQAPLEPGDVVCHDRPERPNGPCAGTNFENAGSKGHMVSHGEIVLEVNAERGYAITIGGNTSQEYPRIPGALAGNTVGKHKVAIDGRGFCIASQRKCPYFGVLKPPRETPESEGQMPGSRRWSWLFGPASMEEDVHDPSLTETRAVRLTVIGHASARWRGARGQTEASRLNEALSNRRADNVREFVEQILRQQLPTIPILPGGSPAPGQQPSGLHVGSYGVGSREPQAPSNDPRENDPRNRSVQVLIELVTTQYGVTGASLAPRRISALTDSWYGRVTSVKGAAIGAAGYRLEITIRNPLSNKAAAYSALVGGGGVGGPISLSGSDLEGEFSFTTSESMGFDDFDGQVITVQRVGASLGIEATVAYLTFTALGKGAAMLPFQKSWGLSLKPNLEGSVASGKLSLEGQNPGDWYEVDGGTDTIPFTIDHRTDDGMVLTFPTGRSGLRDIKSSDRARLRDFVTKWVQQL